MVEHNTLVGTSLHNPRGYSPNALVLPAATADAYEIVDSGGTNVLWLINTSASTPVLTWGNTTATAPEYLFRTTGSSQAAFTIEEGDTGNNYLVISTHDSLGRYLELGNATNNPYLNWLGSGSWRFGGASGSSGNVLITNGSSAAPSWSSALTMPAGGAVTFSVVDNTDASFAILEGSNNVFEYDSRNTQELIDIGNSLCGEIQLFNEATGQNEIRFRSGSGSDEWERRKTNQGATTSGGSDVDLITIALPSDSGAWLEVNGVARESGAGTATRSFQIVTCVENDSGTAAAVGTASIDSEQGDSIGTGDLTVVFSGANVIIRAVASSTLALNWNAVARYGVRGGA